VKKTADSSVEQEPAPPLPPLQIPNRLVRLFHALTSYSLRELSRRTGIHRSTLVLYEAGDAEPSTAHLEALAREARSSVEHGREMLRWHDSLAWPRLRAGGGVEALYAKAGEEFRVRLERAYRRFLCLPSLAGGKPGIDESTAMLELAEAERSAAWAHLTEEIARLVESASPSEKEDKGANPA
jgi:transcriptional regulator with XRE-family HTH domain